MLSKITLIIFSFIVAGSLSWADNSTEKSIFIVKNRKSLAHIIISPSASKRVTASAKCLQKYIFTSTGARLPIQCSKGTGINIHIGNIILAKKAGIKLVAHDEFAIVFPDEKNIIIAGGSESGMEYGIYEFLERYVGVRWLFPGKSGEYIKHCKDIKILVKTVQQRPAFIYRYFSNPGEASQLKWFKHMRMSKRDEAIKSNHSLFRLFPVKEFGKTHLEFFPVRNGKRLPPPIMTSWQPCFSASGSAEMAAEKICRYFSMHPDEISYSLGVNDCAGHCACEKCKKMLPVRKNVIGLKNYSQLYYKWVNKVIGKVREKYPNKYFGCLAYNCVIAPPSGIKLNDHLVPLLTFERYQWVNKDIREKIKKLNRGWAKTVHTFGWYDYVYGDRYLIPSAIITSISTYSIFVF